MSLQILRNDAEHPSLKVDYAVWRIENPYIKLRRIANPTQRVILLFGGLEILILNCVGLQTAACKQV